MNADAETPAVHEPERIAAQAVMLGNRLAKNLKRLLPWATRHDVNAYRVYDCDIPELPLSLDRYVSRDGGWHGVLHYFDGRFPHDDSWFTAMRAVSAKALGVGIDRVRLKVRARQEGTSQYEREQGERDLARLIVVEDGLNLLVNLEAYIDTGLFLDHRVMRGLVRRESEGRDVLNLFAYTGAFSVHAAAAGAKSTTTIDLSQTYCDWARDNLLLNGFAVGERHQVIRADVLGWLDAEQGRRFDLAVVDPPTFSNSKRMTGVFDVQRDHCGLLRAVAGLMRPGGAVYFSTNFRRFKPDERAFEPFERVEEISERSIPFDFRDKKIHRAWRLVMPESTQTRGAR